MVLPKMQVSRRGLTSDDGIVYILYMWIDDVRVVKIGVTTRAIEERVVEILTSYWHKYRVFPKLYPKRFKKTTRILEKEQMLHTYFADRKYEFAEKFDGSSEYFLLDNEAELLEVYSDCLEGIDVNSGEYKVMREYEESCGSIDAGNGVRVYGLDGIAEVGLHTGRMAEARDEEG